MRKILYRDIVEATAKACIEANIIASSDLIEAYQRAITKEVDELSGRIMHDLYENAKLAKSHHLPICQDTGTAVIFLEIGQNVLIDGGFLMDAFQEGVADGYQKGYLRKSIVSHPLTRKNTGNNTPAVIHVDIVAEDVFKVTVAPKGGGSENMSRLKMLTPSEGLEGFKEFVFETIRLAGPNPCPPIVVGACLGGNFESCALQAKKNLLRPIGQRHSDPELSILEEKWLEEINALHIGPQGFGGKTTAFDVHLEFLPCHIASMPAAVNLNCHVSRHQQFEL